jgi:TRAP-type C4-dicarboxylate transport system permease small subunit
MNRFARMVARTDAIATSASLWLCSAIMVTMVAVAGLGVVFRFALHASLSWSEELDAYLFVWLTCLGAAVGVQLRVHPSVMAVADRLPKQYRTALSIASDTAILCLGALMAFYGGQLILLMGPETASSLPISMSYPTLAIPVGGALFMVHSLAHIMDTVLSPSNPGNNAKPPFSVTSDVV